MDLFKKEYYTSDEVAELLGVTKRSIRNYIKQGKISGTKYGGRWNFTKEDIDKYIKNENNQFLNEEKERTNYNIFKSIYFFDSESEIQEKINALVDFFNKYQEKNKNFNCKMSCEVKENLKLEFTLIGSLEEIKGFISQFSKYHL